MTAAVFGVGYVLGTKAGRERYAQIVDAAQKASERLEEYGNGGRRSAGGTRTNKRVSPPDTE